MAAARQKIDDSLRRTCLLGVAASMMTAAPAMADVVEIASNGSVVTRTGAGAVHWNARRDVSSLAAAPEDDVSSIDAPPLPDAAVRPVAVAAVPAAYAAAVANLAAKYDMSPALIEALVWQESRWQTRAVSRVGAIGLAQLMPATARSLGVNPHDPVANLEGGARFLRAQLDLFDGDIEKALAAYNAGPARVLKAGGIPPIAETRAYVAAIVARLASSSNGD